MLAVRKSGRRAHFLAGLRPPAEKSKDLQQLIAWVIAGQPNTVVEREYDLGEIAAAHTRVETGRKDRLAGREDPVTSMEP
jgi:NADPH:quinone reductase-like Zn-dependent oxidoreductase